MAAALCPLTRDDPGYWRRRPADHGPDGLFRDGPRMAGGVLARLIAPSLTSALEPSAAQAHHQRQQARRRAMQRQATPAPRLAPSEHPRRCKKAVRAIGRWVA